MRNDVIIGRGAFVPASIQTEDLLVLKASNLVEHREYWSIIPILSSPMVPQAVLKR